jgi:large subunit ribosomal protein L19
MNKNISLIEKKNLNKFEGVDKTCPEIGDVLRIFIKIKEGEKERLQRVQGVVIAINNSGIRKSFTLRSFMQAGGIERIFTLNSPSIDRIETIKQSKVRRSKLYYLRTRSGKSTRLPSR